MVPGGAQPPRRESSSAVLTSAELQRVPGRTLEEAIRQLRPEYLSTNSAESVITGGDPRPVVYLDNTLVGTVDALRTIPIGTVTEIRFLRPSAAHDWFGAMCPCDRGVILVSTSRAQ